MKFTEEQSVQMALECGGWQISTGSNSLLMSPQELTDIVNLAATKAYQAGRKDALVEAADSVKQKSIRIAAKADDADDEDDAIQFKAVAWQHLVVSEELRRMAEESEGEK